MKDRDENIALRESLEEALADSRHMLALANNRAIKAKASAASHLQDCLTLRRLLLDLDREAKAETFKEHLLNQPKDEGEKKE